MNPFVQHNTFGETLHFVSHNIMLHTITQPKEGRESERVRERRQGGRKRKRVFLFHHHWGAASMLLSKKAVFNY